MNFIKSQKKQQKKHLKNVNRYQNQVIKKLNLWLLKFDPNELNKKYLPIQRGLNMTLEQLEKDYWPKPPYDSNLVKTCNLLRKKQLKDFDTEDLRIMIGQNFSLNYLIPIALKILNNNLLAEGVYYPGDLLVSVLKSDSRYWKSNENDWTNLNKMIINKLDMLISFELNESTRTEILNLYEKFEKIKAC